MIVWLLAATSDEATKIIEDGENAGATIAQAFDQLWTDVISPNGGLYVAIAKLGAFFAVGTVVIWVVVWAKALIEDDSGRPFSELIWPLIVVALLANKGQLLADSTLAIRSIINQTNQSVIESTAGSIRLGEAYKQVMQDTGRKDVTQGLLVQCASISDSAAQKACIDNAKAQAQQLSGQSSSGFQKFLDGVFQFNPLGAVGNTLTVVVRGWLILFGIAFQMIVEVSMLLTALLGPLAVGGSLLPVGQKAIFIWLTGFFSIGIAKLSFNIICGLVATMALKADGSDPMIFAFAVGLLAPVLSLVIASGGGMALFNSLASTATFGLGRILPLGIK